jgi:hypothetical protein
MYTETSNVSEACPLQMGHQFIAELTRKTLKFEALTSVTMKVTVSWDMTSLIVTNICEGPATSIFRVEFLKNSW